MARRQPMLWRADGGDAAFPDKFRRTVSTFGAGAFAGFVSRAVSAEERADYARCLAWVFATLIWFPLLMIAILPAFVLLPLVGRISYQQWVLGLWVVRWADICALVGAVVYFFWSGRRVLGRMGRGVDVRGPVLFGVFLAVVSRVARVRGLE